MNDSIPTRRPGGPARNFLAGASAAALLLLAGCGAGTGPGSGQSTPCPVPGADCATAVGGAAGPAAASPGPSGTATRRPPTATRAASVTATAEPVTPTATPAATAAAMATAASTVQAAAAPPAADPGAVAAEAGRRLWGLQLALDEVPERRAAEAALLPAARAAGLRSLRTNIRWADIEAANTSPDRYDWAATDARLAAYARAGFSVLGTLVAYPPWATEFGCGGGLKAGREADWQEWVGAVAARYSRPPYSVTAWEIGNEVDGETLVRDDDRARPAGWGRGEPTVPHGGCWGDRAAAYARFLRLAYDAVKAAAPNAVVTYGGLAYVQENSDFLPGFFDALLDAGGGSAFDVANIHWFPDITQPLSGPQRLARLRASMDRHGLRKPIWLTEVFRVTFVGQPESEARQIGFLSREIVEMLAAPDVTRAYWYGYVDFPEGYGNVPQLQRGLLRGDLSPKAAFPVLPFTVRATTGRPEPLPADGLVAWRFRGARGGTDSVVAYSPDGAHRPLSLAVPPGTTATVTWFPEPELLAGRCCNQTTVTAPEGTLTLDVGPDALFVELPAR